MKVDSKPDLAAIEVAELNHYQIHTRTTAIYPAIAEAKYLYPVLGLASETGELVGKVKKIWRDDGGKLTDERRELLLEELGDVLWYVARLADELNIPLSKLAGRNLAKLKNRQIRSKLSGSGDHR
jgi:NTP pyrophosphatase (non-canonical NTP hydrolase)